MIRVARPPSFTTRSPTPTPRTPQAHAGGDGLFVRLARRVYEASSNQQLRFQGVFVNGGVDEVRLLFLNCLCGAAAHTAAGACQGMLCCRSRGRVPVGGQGPTRSQFHSTPPLRTRCTTLWTTCFAPTKRPTAPTARGTPTASRCCW